MGIYKFYAEYITRLPKDIRPKSIAGLRGRRFDAILIDANGVLHPIAQEVFQYAGGGQSVPPKKQSMEKYMQEYRDLLFETFDKLIEEAQIPKTVVIAVDGVAPAAKITQQRARRYSAETVGDVAGGLFDSAMITPGTDFMNSVDAMILEYVDILRSAGHRVIYSSHMNPGEGEHKMFWIAKDLVADGELPKNANIIVDGLDADLFMISLTADFNVTLLRGDEYFEINSLKEYLQSILRARQRKLPFQRVYEDFIIMLYLVGNDFLPKLDVLSNVRDLFDVFVEIHKTLPRTISRGNGEINFGMLKQFFRGLAAQEEGLLRQKTFEVASYFYPHHVLHSERVIAASRERQQASNASDHRGSSEYMRLVSSGLYRSKNAIDVAYNYIDGIFWVFNYYTQKSSWSKRWIYQYDIAPLAKHLALAMDNYSLPDELFAQDNFFTTSQQLVSVIPPRIAEKFLPRKISRFIVQGGELEDLAPIKTQVVLSGIKREKDTHMGKRLLPKLDVTRVIETVRF